MGHIKALRKDEALPVTSAHLLGAAEELESTGFGSECRVTVPEAPWNEGMKDADLPLHLLTPKL